jgi:hypothetical protein
MISESFYCTLWHGNGSWGVYVGKPKARVYFERAYPKITVQFEDKCLKVALDRDTGSNTFWGRCPEFRHLEIKRWVERNGISVENRDTVTFEMQVVKRYQHFRLLPTIAQQE